MDMQRRYSRHQVCSRLTENQIQNHGNNLSGAKTKISRELTSKVQEDPVDTEKVKWIK